MPKFDFIDLCAGIGGLRIPFEAKANKGSDWRGLNGQCVFTSEKDENACKTYAENFKGKSSAQTLYDEIDRDFTLRDPNSIPNHDLLLAGFPCQPFSQAGKRRGFTDERGSVFAAIANIIRVKQPRVVLLENVRGLLSLKNPDSGTHAIEEILQELESCGYFVPKPRLFNARDYGLPQNRVRLFILAIRNDIARKNDLVNNADFERYWPKPTCDRDSLKVGDFLERNVPSSYTISDRLWQGHLERKEKNKSMGKGFGYQAFDRSSSYVATISARYYKDGAEALLLQKNKNPRKLTPRETGNLQGFPENFILSESKVQAYKQFGNAVPINVVHAIAKKIEVFLSNK
jgi:DNA (cytosine-5)-methyltransferase 1